MTYDSKDIPSQKYNSGPCFTFPKHARCKMGNGNNPKPGITPWSAFDDDMGVWRD